MSRAQIVEKTRGTIVLLASIHAINADFTVTTKAFARKLHQTFRGSQRVSKNGVDFVNIADAFFSNPSPQISEKNAV